MVDLDGSVQSSWLAQDTRADGLATDFDFAFAFSEKADA